MEIEGLEQLDININSGKFTKTNSSKSSKNNSFFVYLFTIIIIPGFITKKIFTYILKKHNEANEKISLRKYSGRKDEYKIIENTTELIKEDKKVYHNYYGSRKYS